MKNFEKKKKFISLGIVLFVVCAFFYQFLFFGKLPIPSDTITGLYHPFRDLYADNYPNGMPYKNFLVTDPVRQQYIWKELSIDSFKQNQLPIWNIYEMSGKPLLANFQSGVFYPLNVILFLSPFSLSWSVFIFLQMILGAVFMWLYLKYLKLSDFGVVLGSLSWVFSGFFISWLEWGVIGHTALWLPLLLFSTHKLLEAKRKRFELGWFFVLLLSFVSAFFAGHLQTFFYLASFWFIYASCVWFVSGRKIGKLLPFITMFILFITITSVQWAPTLQYIELSNRSSDLPLSNPGWFMPSVNLTQFLAPDFLGNPSTLNYYGVFNYGEFVGYVGIGALFFTLVAVLFRRDKKTLFYSSAIAFCLVFILKNPISMLPYQFNIPFLSSAQPTRLLVLVCFSLSVLSALGFDIFVKKKLKMLIPVTIFSTLLALLWLSTIFGKDLFENPENVLVAQSNLRLPSLIFVTVALPVLLYRKVKKNFGVILLSALIGICILDLLRFGLKYTPFTSSEYLFPQTLITQYLQNDESLYRIGTTDDRILPPNFSTQYRIESIEGYDPLYSKDYARFIAASEREDHSVHEPFGFNRTIRPRNLDTQVSDFLNMKYVLTFSELGNPKFEKVLDYGTTKLYRNNSVLPRAYFIQNVISVENDSSAAQAIHAIDLASNAVVYEKDLEKKYSVGDVDIEKYTPYEIVIKTKNDNEGFLVISDTFYPSFRATIDGKDSRIIKTNMAFRGLVVPSGKHTIRIKPGLF